MKTLAASEFFCCRLPSTFVPRSAVQKPRSDIRHHFCKFPSYCKGPELRLCHFTLKCSSQPLSKPDDIESGTSSEDLLLKKMAVEIVSDLKGSCLFLIGMTGGLMSSLGITLSKALGYYYFDSEKLVEQAYSGHSTAQKLREKNLDEFRDSESEVLRQLSSMGRLVVSTSDDAVLRAENLGLMRHGVTIWLDVPLEALAKQIVAENAYRQSQSNGIAETYSQVLKRVTECFESQREVFAVADVKISLQKIAAEHGCNDVLSIRPAIIAIEVFRAISKLLRYKKLQEAAAAPEIQYKND